MSFLLRNPKRDSLSMEGKSGFYNYYASFSPGFVRDAIKFLNLNERSLIMDPWNGSGTTTQIAQEMGFTTIGYDINPAMVIVAKARTLDPDVVPSLILLSLDIISKAKQYRKYPLAAYEPLETWFMPGVAGVIRNIERAVQQLLVSKNYSYLYDNQEVKQINSLAAFFYVSLFRCLKELLHNFRSSNPTWIKKPEHEAERIIVPDAYIYQVFKRNVFEMVELLKKNMKNNVTNADKKFNAIIDVADSKKIPLHNSLVDAVISSPPYCTRIDYVIATSLELALLGYDYEIHLKHLRERTIGSPVLMNKKLIISDNWGKSCLDTLNKIYCHSTKASKTYYYKTYVQYFNSVYASLLEINRTLKSSGSCILVVQDSYYKDVHVDLANIFIEMGYSIFWDLKYREDYKSIHNMVGINSKSNRYRGRTPATESVLVFSKNVIGGSAYERGNRLN